MSGTIELFQAKQAEAEEAYELAGVYWRDGAIASAARSLDRAADLAREAQAIRNEAFGINDPATVRIVRIPAELAGKLAEFFDRTMGKMNVGASALDAQAISNWNECSGGVEKYCRQDETTVSA